MSTPTSSPLSDEQVREYEQMLAAVNGVDSKWIYDARNQYLAVASGRIDGDWDEVMANERFIAASPTIVAALLADRSRLSARVEELERDAKRLDALAEYVAMGIAQLTRATWDEGVTIGLEAVTGEGRTHEAEPHATSHEALRATLDELIAAQSR